MTVTSETNRVSYSGDDSTVDFTVPFYFLLDSSITVTLVAADETETTWVLNTDYTVTDSGVLAGGSITADTAPATGQRLVIIRSESLTQTTDYIENDDFPAASHERALDKAMMINQQQQEEIARCITAPVGDDGTTDYTLPVYSASKVLQWDPSTQMLRNAELTTTGTATIGTDAGDLVKLVEISSGVVGWPAVNVDNMLLSGVALGSVITKDHGTTSGTVAVLTSGDVIPLSTFALDEDDLASDSVIKAPTQHSVKAYIDAVVLATIPTGDIKTFLFETVPTGYLECDGSTVSRTTYSTLFSAIGDLYGVGDGSTTFEIPDLRGKFLRGWDHGAGTDPDAASRTDSGDGSTTGDHVGTNQADAFKSHDHLMVGGGGAGTVSTGAHGDLAASTGRDMCGLEGGDETRPINVNVMHCIKY